MKKILETSLGIICCLSVMLACCVEKEDGSCPVILVLLLFLVAFICARILSAFFLKIRICDATYDDLNKQIEDYASRIGDGYHERTFDSENVAIKVGVRNKTTQIKFKDDAWGNVQTFTETSWQSNIEVLEVTVYDENEHPTDNHDFDETRIETEYEGGGSWE